MKITHFLTCRQGTDRGSSHQLYERNICLFFSAAKILVGRAEVKSPLAVEQGRGVWRGN